MSSLKGPLAVNQERHKEGACLPRFLLSLYWCLPYQEEVTERPPPRETGPALPVWEQQAQSNLAISNNRVSLTSHYFTRTKKELRGLQGPGTRRVEELFLHFYGSRGSLGLSQGPGLLLHTPPPHTHTSTSHPLLSPFSPLPLSAQAGLTSSLATGMKWIRHKGTQTSPWLGARLQEWLTGKTRICQSSALGLSRTPVLQNRAGMELPSGGHASASSPALGLTDTF